MQGTLYKLSSYPNWTLMATYFQIRISPSPFSPSTQVNVMLSLSSENIFNIKFLGCLHRNGVLINFLLYLQCSTLFRFNQSVSKTLSVFRPNDRSPRSSRCSSWYFTRLCISVIIQRGQTEISIYVMDSPTL